MSQRLGMADGRCFTLNSAAQLTNAYIMNQNGIPKVDNYSYRQLLQKEGPQLISKLQGDHAAPCPNCDKPHLDTSKTY